MYDGHCIHSFPQSYSYWYSGAYRQTEIINCGVVLAPGRTTVVGRSNSIGLLEKMVEMTQAVKAGIGTDSNDRLIVSYHGMGGVCQPELVHQVCRRFTKEAAAATGQMLA